METEFPVHIILLLVVISIAAVIMTSSLKPGNVEAGPATQLVDRVTGSLWLTDEPAITVRSGKIDGEFEYELDAVVGMNFIGKTAEEITVFPVVTFKGAKDRDTKPTEITLKRDETKQTALNFKLQSREMPMKINDKSTEFKCGPDLSECYVHDKEKLLLKNFSFSFSAFQIDPSEIPFVLPGLPKIGPCVLVSEIQCPFEKKSASLKLDDEGKKCDEQKDKKNCAKTEKMCGTLASIELVKIDADESFIERIAPGSPKCSDKLFAVEINVGKVDENVFGSKFSWKVGEDVFLSFWEKPAKKDLENCWKDGGEGCADLYLGERIVTIPVENYLVVE